jgi:hypothetical protein
VTIGRFLNETLVNTSRAHQLHEPTGPRLLCLDKGTWPRQQSWISPVADRLLAESTRRRHAAPTLHPLTGPQKPRRGARTSPGASGSSKAAGGLLGAHRARRPDDRGRDP